MKYLSHVDKYQTVKYKYKYQVLHLWFRQSLMAIRLSVSLKCHYGHFNVYANIGVNSLPSIFTTRGSNIHNLIYTYNTSQRCFTDNTMQGHCYRSQRLINAALKSYRCAKHVDNRGLQNEHKNTLY